MKQLECLLRLTPSLESLKLISLIEIRDQRFDGFYWEQFISNNLCLLNKFQFYFIYKMSKLDNIEQLMSFIRPFQSSFWLIDKYWPVICNFVPKQTMIRLYTTPIFENCQTNDLKLELSSMTPTYCITFDFSKTVHVFQAIVLEQKLYDTKEDTLLLLFRHLLNQCVIHKDFTLPKSRKCHRFTA